MAEAKGPSAGKRVGGVALMLLGVALIGWGAHYLAKNGNCSSTGYVSYGPVPKCSGGEALYITSTFFLGPGLAVAGWLMAQAWGVLWPAVCLSVGIGMITLYADSSAASGARSFGLVAGVVFAALAVLSIILTVRKRRRPRPAATGPAGLASVLSTPAGPPATAGPPPMNIQPMRTDSPDPLDRIAKLAQLRDSGALTNEEYEAQKAKLLAEM
jgi:putative oligomerization/nucleic acid binding protein